MIHSNPRIKCDTHAASIAQRRGTREDDGQEGTGDLSFRGWVEVLQADKEKGKREKSKDKGMVAWLDLGN